MTKRRLYYLVETIRNEFRIDFPPPYDAKMLCTAVLGLHLDTLELKTPKLRGMSHIPSRSVVIDSKRSEREQNFFCMHEIMHHTAHKNRPTKLYSCYDETPVDQDPFIEWEANEGAAQFLVPYQDFIPRASMYFNAYCPGGLVDLPNILADHYFVSPQVINIRLDNLSYEIEQYRNGRSIEEIELLSRTQRKNLKKKFTNYSALCAFSLDWNATIKSFEQMPERIHI